MQRIFAKHARLAVRLCTERIVDRDIMPVLEEAQKIRKTVEQMELATVLLLAGALGLSAATLVARMEQVLAQQGA